jgi:hypothetical protein
VRAQFYAHSTRDDEIFN